MKRVPYAKSRFLELKYARVSRILFPGVVKLELLADVYLSEASPSKSEAEQMNGTTTDRATRASHQP